MKTKTTYLFLLLMTMVLGLHSCKADKVDGAVFSLSIDGQESTSITFGYGQTFVMAKLSSNTGWSLSSDQPWCTLSNVSGDPTDEQYIKIAVERNTTDAGRTATITMNAGGNIRQYTVTQTSKNAETYPVGMEKDAIETIKSIQMGINLGNTLEATDGEEAWGAPRTTQAIIDQMKAWGFNAIRVPCSWNQYLEADGITIKPDWMNRVKEVVDYCMNADMYTIINIHWDGGWMEGSCDASMMTSDSIARVEAKVYKLWTQIATTFRDYDGRLLFAGANEPVVESREDMIVLNRYEQAFVHAVRRTGGNNLYRNLVIQGPRTDINRTDMWMELPEDTVSARTIVEVHYYDPFNFCLNEEEETSTYFWGKPYAQYGPIDEGWQEEHVCKQFDKMKKKFVDKGIPLVLGEYCSMYRTHPVDSLQEICHESQGYFTGYVTEQAKNNGLAPFLWDIQNGGLFDRSTGKILLPTVYNQLKEGAERGQYPF